MPTAMDKALDAIMDGLTAPGQPFATTPITLRGVEMPAFALAPPSLTHYYAHYCAEHGDKPFIVDGDMRLSFAETFAAASAVARGLVQHHGLARGERVALAARNSASWLVAFIGITMAGGCAVLVNGFWEGGELAEGIQLCDTRLVLADEGRAKRLAAQPLEAELIRIAHDCPPREGLANVWSDDDSIALPELGPDDHATILFTSGSTGSCKGALSDHRGVVHGTMSYAAQSLMGFTYLGQQGKTPEGQPCTLICVPMFHVTGLVPVFMQSFALGRKLVLMPRWDAHDALKLMEKERVTYFVGVPLMSYELATHPNRHEFDLSACGAFAAGGSPRPVDHVHSLREAFPDGFPILGYGLTETNAVGCGNFNENYIAKPGSTGPASRPIVDLAIIDDDGVHQPQGDIAEVCIRSAANFLGYWDNEEATHAAFTEDGYFRTGDLGYIDEDGYLFIVDRKKDIIIRGGENIACSEVEQAIYANDKVAECSVFGVPDARFGEVPMAVYYVTPGQSLAPDALAEFLKGKLAAFKIPVRFDQWDEPLPRLGTQKIDKRRLQAAYIEGTEDA